MTRMPCLLGCNLGPGPNPFSFPFQISTLWGPGIGRSGQGMREHRWNPGRKTGHLGGFLHFSEPVSPPGIILADSKVSSLNEFYWSQKQVPFPFPDISVERGHCFGCIWNWILCQKIIRITEDKFRLEATSRTLPQALADFQSCPLSEPEGMASKEECVQWVPRTQLELRKITWTITTCYSEPCLWPMAQSRGSEPSVDFIF